MKVGVEKRGGRWVFRWRPPGQKHQRHWPQPPIYHKALALEAATVFARELLSVHQASMKPGLRPADRWDFDTLVDRWLEARANVASAFDHGRVCRRAAVHLGVTFLDELAVDHIRAYRLANHSESALRRLKGLLLWAREERQAVDPAVLKEMRPRVAGKRSNNEALAGLITEPQMKAIRREADRRGQLPLIHCLARFGWRPITANLLRVRDINLTTRIPTASLWVKQADEPYVHPLDEETIALLRPLIEGRQPGDPLFRNPRGERWKMEINPLNGMEVSASQMRDWYRNTCRRHAPGCGNIYGLKRYALTAMHEGRRPWKKPLSLRQIRLYTGHKTDSEVARYLRTNLDEAYDLLGGTGGKVAKTGGRKRHNKVLYRADPIQFPAKSGG